MAVTVSDDEFEIVGHAGAYVIVRKGSDRIHGCFYERDEAPGWWRGHVNGRGVKEYFVPGGDVDPVDVATRFLGGCQRR